MNEQGLSNITNGASLELVGDIPMQINDSLLIKIIGKQDINPNLHSTRIEWDCKGLKDIALVVSATLPRSIFVPEENNKRSAFGRVTGIAEVHISSIQNFMVAFAIDKDFYHLFMNRYTKTFNFNDNILLKSTTFRQEQVNKEAFEEALKVVMKGV